MLYSLLKSTALTALTPIIVSATTTAAPDTAAVVSADSIVMSQPTMIQTLNVQINSAAPVERLFVAANVDMALIQLQNQHPNARVSLQKSNPQSHDVLVSTLKTITIKANNKTFKTTTTQTNARELLTHRKINNDSDDFIKLYRPDGVRTGSILWNNMVLEFVKVNKSSKIKDIKINRPTKTVNDPNMVVGTSKVVDQGRDGVNRYRYHYVYHNNKLVSSTKGAFISQTKPKTKVVKVGTKKPAYPLVAGGAESRNWTALAKCESSNNPKAANPAGYYGLYQFNTSTWRSVGGSGLPSQASAAEQTYRAKLLYKSRGKSPWPHCGRYL